MTTYIRHRDKKPLLITEYGWHEGDCTDSEVWTADREHAEAFARKEGLSNILVESNYGTFVYPQRIDRDFRRSLGTPGGMDCITVWRLYRLRFLQPAYYR